MVYSLNQSVVVHPGAPGEALFGTIAGGPTLIDGNNLAWPVKLEAGLWAEGRKVFVRVLLVNQELIKPWPK